MVESLRTHPESWLIWDEDSMAAVAKAMRMYSQSVTGQKLARHPDKTIRGIGNMMVRIAEANGRAMLDGTDHEQIAVKWFSLLGAHLADVPHDEVECQKARDELHAVAFRMSQKQNVLPTIDGPGTMRAILRGD